ncbi:MAG: DUF2298 domain-containing protein [Chloroflexota bacterium]|nr:DUF2298 domain-containing protein [Chloroflexota bacterium]
MRTSAKLQPEVIVLPTDAQRVVVGRKRGVGRTLGRFVRTPWLLLPIALIAFLLRVHGLNWDAGYHLHPDERFITEVITDRILPDWPPNWRALLDPEHSPLNPRSNDPATSQPRDFAYGSLPLYVTKAVAGTMQVATGTAWTDYDHVYLVGRVLSALLDIGTLLLVYALARRYGRAYANLAAALFAVCVLPIQLAHFFATDTWVTFFATAAVFAFVRAAERQRTRDFVIAGALVGAGVASKASVAFLAFPALAALAIAVLRARPVPDGTDEEAVSPRLRALFLTLTTFWAALITFAISEPYALFRLRTYLAAVGTQARLARGDLDYPYTRQYVGTGLLYHIRNLVLWGMGPALGLLVIVGLAWALVRAWRRRATVDLVLLAWLIPYLLYTIPQSVKFMRYLQPVYPALIVLGVALLRDLINTRTLLLSRRWRPLTPYLRGGGRAATAVVVVCTALWAAAFSTIYDQSPSRVTASVWMKDHVPAGATVATEVWDDALPLPVPGVPPYGCVRLNTTNPDQCTGLDLYPDEGSGEARLQYLARALAQSDYIVESSNRLYGSIPKLPWRYPVTIRYYDLLFAGKLGFTTVYDQTVSPHLGPWRIDDRHADESFTVYDHPRVTIFKKTETLSIAQLRPLFADVLPVKAAPQRDPPPKSLLLSGPVESLPAVSDRAWAGTFGRGSVVAVMLYLALFELFGLIGWAMTARLFRRFPDRGWGVGKLVGWLGCAYVVWLGASVHAFAFTLPWCVAAVAIACAVAAFVYWRQRAAFRALLRSSWPVMLAAEAATVMGFFLFLAFRLKNPDLWQTYWGGEKPFEMAQLNAILRSAHFPPYDPWFAGGYINYYYFGGYLHAFVMKLTGIAPEVAFNVAVPITMALVWGAAFSTGAALWVAVRRRQSVAGPQSSCRPEGARSSHSCPIVGGICATAAIGLFGNLDAFGQVAHALGDGLGIRGAMDRFDFWESTRIIPGTINEFPFFSGLWADLHAHVIALPFAILAVAVSVAIGLTPRPPSLEGKGEKNAWRTLPWGALALAGLIIGALYCTNAWDFPTALTLIWLGLIVRLRASRMAWLPVGITATVGAAGVGIVAYLCYLPFFTHFQSLYGTLARVRQPSPLGAFLVIFGMPCLVIAVALLLLRPARGWFMTIRADARAAIIAGAGACGLGAALATHRFVLAVTLPLLGTLAVVWLRMDAQPGRRIAIGIAGVGLGLLSVIEVVFLADDLIGGDFERMNTVFKFDFQAWTLLGLASVALISIIVDRWRVTPAGWQVAVSCLLGAAVFLSLFYPVFGTPARLRQRMPSPPTNAGLDGFAWMATGFVPADQFNNSGSGEPVYFADDLALIRWLNTTVHGTPVIAEASIGPYRGNGSRISSATGFPTIIGWERHEEQQRGPLPVLSTRVDDVRRIYTSSEPRAVQDVLDRYHVQYIVVGDVERKTKLAAGQIGATANGESYASPIGLTTLSSMADQGMLRVAWQSGTTMLYEVVGGWRAGATDAR